MFLVSIVEDVTSNDKWPIFINDEFGKIREVTAVSSIKTSILCRYLPSGTEVNYGTVIRYSTPGQESNFVAIKENWEVQCGCVTKKLRRKHYYYH
jgi:hypothetical protein